jgi:beta-phosphoglucomutase-like phosphatase (HAD superfamily)
MSREEVDHLYHTFMPLQIAAVAHFAAPIPGVLPVLARLREQGLRIGSCSGYPRPVMEALVWLRVPGDIVFAAGSVLLGVNALKLLRTGRRSQAATAVAMPSLAER